MRVAVAFDHRGVKLRERLLEVLAALGHEAVDLGTDRPEPRIDYPDKARAHQGVEHDDMNVLCLGSEVIGPELAAELARAFLEARFDGGERYVRRLEKIEEMERETTYG
jgi:ribose 5-phosphate isomerase B